MSQSDITRAYGRASADLDRELDRQHDVKALLLQVSDVEAIDQAEEDDTLYFVIRGAHRSGFRIAVAVTAAGSIGWALV